MRGGAVQRPYQKIVGPGGARGCRLAQVVHRLPDPPPGLEATGILRIETPGPELHARGSDRERHVETVVDE
jgi:hypothetical protein